MKHLGPLALFAALALAWTWPLALHLQDAVPGGPGDNYSFLWNLWWMRHVMATPGLPYFHTTFVFYPFGTTLADHPQTALPAIVAATLLKPASIVTAQNLLLLGYVFGNMACAYALVWDIARHRRAAILGGVIFGLSPYLASHLLGHFDLVAAFPLPLFALCVRRATASGARLWAAAAGAVMVATAYTAYYYVVYLLGFLAVYLISWAGWTPVAWSRRQDSIATPRLHRGLAIVAIALGAVALWIVVTGGRTLELGPIAISARTPQNVLTGIWICGLVYACSTWRPGLTHAPIPVEPARRAITIAAGIAIVFAIGAAPLLWQAALLVRRGEYVTPAYQWRSAPRGVDAAAPLLGPPLHPLMQISERVYAAAHLDRIEAVGWIGIVPVVLLFAALRKRRDGGNELRLWRSVAIVFGLWAIGPILAVGGFDTGMKLPAILLRYIPFVANARMPGRAMVGVFMALAVLAGAELAAGASWRRRPSVQWLLIAIVVFEYWDAPIPLTHLDRPAVYQALAAAPAGAVCEVPFGIGDGLSTGIGSQERIALYYATVHEHPLVGGYIGRMPAAAARRYDDMAVVGPLLRLSDGRGEAGAAVNSGESPCIYLVVNRAAVSVPLRAYLGELPLERIASDPDRDLYRISSSR